MWSRCLMENKKIRLKCVLKEIDVVSVHVLFSFITSVHGFSVTGSAVVVAEAAHIHRQ